MNTTASDDKKMFTINTFCFLVILSFGAFLRFYHLETPSMWWDEVLVAIMSSYPVEYIINWASTVEVHAPYFHIFTKLISQMGSSDFTLKFVPALLGTLSIYYVYKLAFENFDARVALVSSALFAMNPIHIIMSRQLRPYAIVVFLFLISSIHLLRYLKTNKSNNLIVIIACNLISVAFHYNTFLIIATQCMLVAANYVFFKDRNIGKLLKFSVGIFISTLPVVFFFARTIFKLDMGILNSDTTYSHCLLVAAKFYSQLFFLFDLTDPFERKEIVLSLVLFSIGIICIAKKNKLFFVYAIVIILVPILTLTLGKNTFNASRYLLFILPIFCISVGCFLGNLPKAQLFVPAAVVVYAFTLIFTMLFNHHDRYFGPQAHSIFGPAGNSKEIARILTQEINDNELTFFASSALDNTISDEKNAAIWYYSQFVSSNFLKRPKVNSAGSLALNVIATSPSADSSLNRVRLSEADHILPLPGNMILSKYNIARKTTIDIDCFPFVLDMDRTIKILANSQTIESLIPASLTKSIIVPTENNVGCILTEKIISTSKDAKDCNIIFDIYYTLSNRGSTYTCNLSFADNKDTNVDFFYKSNYFQENSQRRLQVVASRKLFPKAIDIEHILNCSLDKPLYAGDNLSNIQLNRVVVQAVKTNNLINEQTFFFDFLTYDLLRENYYKDLGIKGFSEIEYDSIKDIYFRWTEGPLLTIIYETKSPLPSLLSFKYLNVQFQNEISIRINGKDVCNSTDQYLEKNIAFNELVGQNKIEFFTNKYNHKVGESPFAESDPRELGIYFQELTINRNVGSKKYD